MSSSSTNKQPLLIDRPLGQNVSLGPVAALSDPGNFATVVPGGCQLLVDCTGDSDGAVVDSVTVVANQAGTTGVTVILFLSFAGSPLAISPSNTLAGPSVIVPSATAGQRVAIPLFPLSVPVPNLGGMASPGENDKKNTGLYVPRGTALYAGLNQAILVPTPATTVNVFAQGGYF